MIEVYPLLVLIVVLIAGCTGPAESGVTIRTVPPAEVSALIDGAGQDPAFAVIDVRRPDEFAAGHVPGAINIDSRQFGERLTDLDRNGTHVIYCQRGGRSSGIREMMREAGFREVYEIEGGMSAWTVAGLPVTLE